MERREGQYYRVMTMGDGSECPRPVAKYLSKSAGTTRMMTCNGVTDDAIDNRAACRNVARVDSADQARSAIFGSMVVLGAVAKERPGLTTLTACGKRPCLTLLVEPGEFPAIVYRRLQMDAYSCMYHERLPNDRRLAQKHGTYARWKQSTDVDGMMLDMFKMVASVLLFLDLLHGSGFAHNDTKLECIYVHENKNCRSPITPTSSAIEYVVTDYSCVQAGVDTAIRGTDLYLTPMTGPVTDGRKEAQRAAAARALWDKARCGNVWDRLSYNAKRVLERIEAGNTDVHVPMRQLLYPAADFHHFGASIMETLANPWFYALGEHGSASKTVGDAATRIAQIMFLGPGPSFDGKGYSGKPGVTELGLNERATDKLDRMKALAESVLRSGHYDELCEHIDRQARGNRSSGRSRDKSRGQDPYPVVPVGRASTPDVRRSSTPGSNASSSSSSSSASRGAFGFPDSSSSDSSSPSAGSRSPSVWSASSRTSSKVARTFYNNLTSDASDRSTRREGGGGGLADTDATQSVQRLTRRQSKAIQRERDRLFAEMNATVI